MRKVFLLEAIGLFFGLGQSTPFSDIDITPRTPKTYSESCNTPSNRACWSPGFDIETDYEVEIPHTGVTRRVSEMKPTR